ncbi:MAG: hypothetical protein AB1796_02740 [Bacillota bacterium]
MKVAKGFPFYGQRVGVLVFQGKSPRVPGDPGHAKTFPFPVCYEVVEGSFSDLIEGSEGIKNELLGAVKKLKAKGIWAVIGDCGLMALYQQELASGGSLPILTSALVLVPLLWNLVGRKGAIGIITGHAGLLQEQHLRAAGIGSETHLEIQGMELEPHFREIVIEGGTALDVDLMCRDVLAAAGKLLQKNKGVQALLLECSNLATYSHALQEKYQLPVFDITGAALMLEHAVHAPPYVGFGK